jgi:Spy/CpxP family protein refolding chaperone
MKHMEANKHKAKHHYHKNEMEHHKMRDMHKMAHERKVASNHGKPEHTAVVNENHQQGFERVKQKPGSMPVGQHGSMSGGWNHERLK